MTKEEKQLLFVDLCGRLPYGVKVTWDGKHPLTVTPHIYCAIANEDNIDNLPKLLLRPMSSMTEEEYGEWFNFYNSAEKEFLKKTNYTDYANAAIIGETAKLDWLNKHMFDYRGLIEKGLALEAEEGMYKTE